DPMAALLQRKQTYLFHQPDQPAGAPAARSSPPSDSTPHGRPPLLRPIRERRRSTASSGCAGSTSSAISSATSMRLSGYGSTSNAGRLPPRRTPRAQFKSISSREAAFTE